MTPAQLAAIFPGADPAWCNAIEDAWADYGFVSLYAKAGFLAICGNETGGLKNIPHRERLNYSPVRASVVFRKCRVDPRNSASGPNELCIQKCATGEEIFANWIYAGVNGNGDEASGDGWKYRGAGIIQLTGRANFEAFEEASDQPVTTDPDLLARDKAVSAAAAAWFMAEHAKLLPLLDRQDEASFLAAAARVGFPPPGATDTRLRYRRKAIEVLGAAATGGEKVLAPEPVIPAAGSPPQVQTGPWTAIGTSAATVTAAAAQASELGAALKDATDNFGWLLPLVAPLLRYATWGVLVLALVSFGLAVRWLILRRRSIAATQAGAV